MKTQKLMVRGSCLLALVGIAVVSAGCAERVVVRRPPPAVVVTRPVVVEPVVQERVIVR
jgi:hypothetical protein